MKKRVAVVAFFLVSFTTLVAQEDSLQASLPFLPLRVVRFDAAVVSKNVQLRWTVNGNEDAKSFEIERAEEGGIYKKVGSKLAASRNTNPVYEFVDALPKKAIALAYRIKVISKDGAAVYSGLQTTRIEDAVLQGRLKQNPVRTAIEVEVVSAEAANLQASVYTAYGQKVKSETVKLSAGANLLSFSSQNLLPGLHRLVLETGSERKVISFVKE